jgi:hypothetical protein
MTMTVRLLDFSDATPFLQDGINDFYQEVLELCKISGVAMSGIIWPVERGPAPTGTADMSRTPEGERVTGFDFSVRLTEIMWNHHLGGRTLAVVLDPNRTYTDLDRVRMTFVEAPLP